MTCTVLQWIPVFTRPDTVTILLNSLSHLVSEGLTLHAYVILENHLHLIAASEQLDRHIAHFKSYTARMLINYLKKNRVQTILDQLASYKKMHKADREYQFWQEGVHPEQIQGDEMMRMKIEYIHHNPVKRGYVERPEHWLNSSARDYLGMKGPLEVCKHW
jgi:putative transposase